MTLTVWLAEYVTRRLEWAPYLAGSKYDADNAAAYLKARGYQARVRPITRPEEDDNPWPPKRPQTPH